MTQHAMTTVSQQGQGMLAWQTACGARHGCRECSRNHPNQAQVKKTLESKIASAPAPSKP